MSKMFELIDEVLKKYSQDDLEKRDPKTKLPGVLLDKASNAPDVKMTSPVSNTPPSAPKVAGPVKVPAIAKPNLPKSEQDSKKMELAKNLKKALCAKVEKAAIWERPKHKDDKMVDSQQKGIHHPAVPSQSGEVFSAKNKGSGFSHAGLEQRKTDSFKNKQKIKDTHEAKLQELKDMPKPNLPKSESEDKKVELAKNLKKALCSKVEKARSEEKGVHEADFSATNIVPKGSKKHIDLGVSAVGIKTRQGANPLTYEEYKDSNKKAVGIHKEKLSELKQMPKANLPKSEANSNKPELAKNLKKALKK